MGAPSRCASGIAARVDEIVDYDPAMSFPITLNRPMQEDSYGIPAEAGDGYRKARPHER